MSHFIDVDYCYVQGKYYGWDQFQIHLACYQVTQELINMEYESILSDSEDYMKEYKATLKKRTSSESHDKKNKKLEQKSDTKNSSEDTSVAKKDYSGDDVAGGVQETTLNNMDRFLIIIKEYFDKYYWAVVHGSETMLELVDAKTDPKMCW